VEKVITDFCLLSPDNSLQDEEHERAWEEPLVGFSSGSDPLYQLLKKDVGSFYMTPIEVFKQSFPGRKVATGELSVISWILPQTRATKTDNRNATIYPSERWVRAKQYGEAFNTLLRRHVTENLKIAGFEAVAPVLSSFWSIQDSARYGRSSNWSERHAAYVSGLGTFGLCDGLITERGKAMRCGSVVAAVSIQPTRRPYTDHREYCLYFSQGTCGTCITRCPAGAITLRGHDKSKCREYLYRTAWEYVKSCYGIETDVCGLCQTGVLCESSVPAKGPNEGHANE
jgi:epoxyqueuosine reductase QueG